MMDYLDKILLLPKQQKVGLLIVIILAALTLDYYFLYSSYSEQSSALSDEVVKKRAERDKKKALAANKAKLLAELKQLDGRLKEAAAQLPDQKEIPDLLSNISNKAREAGLEITTFRPKPENSEKIIYAEIPVDIVVKGNYHNVATFFDEVGRLSRLVNMTNIEIKNPEAKNPKANPDRTVLETSTLATTFRLLSEEEQKKALKDKTEKEKKATKS